MILPPNPHQGIYDFFDEYETALRAEDINGLMSLYSNDYMHNGDDLSTVESAWTQVFITNDMAGLDISFSIDNISVDQDKAIVKFTVYMSGEKLFSVDEYSIGIFSGLVYLDNSSGRWLACGNNLVDNNPVIEKYNILAYSEFGNASYGIRKTDSYISVMFGGAFGRAVALPLGGSAFFDLIRSRAVMLQFPLILNSTWTGEPIFVDVKGWEATSEVTSLNETVTVGSTVFENCLRIDTVINGTGTYHDDTPVTQEISEFIRGTRTLWFASGVGLVKMVYAHESGNMTVSELQSYEIVVPESSYFPLTAGNRWVYEWTTGYSTGSIIETYIVFDSSESERGDIAGTKLVKTTFDYSLSASGASGHVPEPEAYSLMYLALGSPLITNSPALKDTWTSDVPLGHITGWTGTSIIESVDETVSVAAGTFNGCIRLRTDISGDVTEFPVGWPVTAETNAFARGTRYIWFAPGVGIVKIEYQHEDGTTSNIELTGYDVQVSSDVIPLAEGNSWDYEWTGGHTPSTVYETVILKSYYGIPGKFISLNYYE
ncbi:hypothetical protein ACFL4R_01705 [Nitrospirota bacterium]